MKLKPLDSVLNFDRPETQLRLAMLQLANAVSLADRLASAHRSRKRGLKLRVAEALESAATLLHEVSKEL